MVFIFFMAATKFDSMKRQPKGEFFTPKPKQCLLRVKTSLILNSLGSGRNKRGKFSKILMRQLIF